MKGVDLSNYALEDLLAFDDIFLDYFNNFLKNPAFPQPIQYNRYRSIFEEIEQVPDAIIELDRLPKQVTQKLASTLNILDPSPRTEASVTPNLNEVEQQKVFDWVRQERLPLFFRTDFFREFKMCRLLTRSLEEENATHSAESSQMIGGYSRQSPSISNTLSTEEHEGRLTGTRLFYNSASKRLNESRNTNKNNEDSSRLFKTNNIDMSLLEKFNKVLFQRPGSRALSVPSYFPFQSINFSTNQANVLLKSRPTEEPSTREKSSNHKANRLAKFKDSSKKEGSQSERVQIEDLINGSNSFKLEKTEDSIKLGTDDFKNSTQDFKASMVNSETSDKRTIAFSDKKNENSEMFYNDLTKSYDEEDFVPNLKSKKDDEEMDEDDVLMELKQNNKTNFTNQSIKIDDNISFIEDDENLDFIDNEDLHASINQYKLKFLGSVKGMVEFKEFLRNTSGFSLMKFWLDCEFYRDSMQDYDQIENMATRNRLFRDINEKYVFPFSKKMHQKISQNYLESKNLNHTIFDNIQYDVLRRIRAYWVPRFIITKLKAIGKDYGYSFPLPPITPHFSRQSTYISAQSAGRNTLQSAKLERDQTTKEQDDDNNNLLYEKVRDALHADKAAGGPFLRYISGSNPDNLPLILFWYDVCDFYEIDSIGFDKNSRLQHAWAIYNSYLSPTARFNIGLPYHVAEEARKSLQIISGSNSFNSINSIDKNLFQPVMEQIIPHLQGSWIKFIKDDVFKYTQSRLAALLIKQEEGDSETENELQDLFDKIPEPDLVMENQTIFLKRPWIKNFLEMSTREKVQKKVLTEEEKIERMERKRIMEIERKKALKKAKRRLDAEKQKADNQERTDEEELDNSKRTTKKLNSLQTDKSTYFNKMLNSNKSMMQLYRKNFVDTNRRDFLNKFNSFLDAKQYTESLDQVKKAKLALSLLQVYLNNSSKKKILPLNEKLQKKLDADLKMDKRGQSRPRTPFCKELVKEFRPSLEEEFVKFCEEKRREHELESPEDFANLTQTELLVLLGDSYNAKNFDFDDDKGDGKFNATKEDRQELTKYLYEWSIGNSAEKFWNYFVHLGDYGPKDGLPYLDKDLLFCIDAVRMREISGDAVLRQKASMIVENYLDSHINPSVQIDMSPDMAQKLNKAASRIIGGTHTPHDLTLFDEARVQLVKELLPYWAGYCHYARNSENEPPLSKHQKKLKERLEEFLSLKNTSPEDFKLPVIEPRHSPKKSSALNSSLSNSKFNANRLSNIVFSIATGIRYKDERTMMREESQILSEKTLGAVGRKSSTVL